MKNYSPNRNTPSRSFYVSELKKSTKNLNKRNNQLDFLEKKLDSLLTYSFKFFHPFFNDEEYEANKNYYKTPNDVDDEFDKTLEKHLPSWLLVVFGFFNQVYIKIIGTKTVQSIIIKVRKVVSGFKNMIVNKRILKTRKFFAFKSPP